MVTLSPTCEGLSLLPGMFGAKLGEIEAYIPPGESSDLPWIENDLQGAFAKAKAEGRYTGRKKSIDDGEIRRLKGEGVGATEIARRLNINRASVYRV